MLGLAFVSLGSIIGSGWLLGALIAATSAGGASVLSWLLAGAIVVLLGVHHRDLDLLSVAVSAGPTRANLSGTHPLAFGVSREI
ncbi:MAG: hypothetical protein M3Y48_14980 [Actinomycetota bacterium]|nr:hypothetical protein [Actinomycetota bacterium]